jgi:hypothetical protein
MNFFRSKKLQEPRASAVRKLSLRTGTIARKLRFDPTMSESDIIEWLQEAKDNAQYSNITFDDIEFTNACLATLVQVFSTLAKRHQSYWDRLNIEFCRGPVDMVITTALLLDCVKHLFVAAGSSSEDENGDDTEGLVVRLSAALQVNLSLKSLWLLIPLKLEAVRALGQALAMNDALNKLSLSGCKWDLIKIGVGDDDDYYDTDAYGTDTDDEYMESSRFLNSSDDEDEPEVGALDKKKSSFYTDPAVVEKMLQLPKAFAEGLCHNTSLRTFDLSCCELMDDVLAIILQALVGHPTLEHLDISRNRAGRESIRALAELVGHPQSTLMHLNLGEQRKKSKRKGPNKVAKGRRRKPSTEDGGEKDDDEDNEDDFDSAAARDGLDLIPLSQALYNNDTLQVLKLCHNRLTDDQVSELVRNLQGNESLQHLDLQFNCITTTGVKAITKGLSNLPALKELLLGGNDFGKEGNKILAQLEDDDDSVCTIMESDDVDRKAEDDNETFHSARTSKSSGTATLRKSRASVPAAALSGGLMGGLTGIAQSRKSTI